MGIAREEVSWGEKCEGEEMLETGERGRDGKQAKQGGKGEMREITVVNAS